MSVLAKIERYLRENDVTPTRFGKVAARDPRLVHDLRRGRDPGPRMIARIEAYLTGKDAQ